MTRHATDWRPPAYIALGVVLMICSVSYGIFRMDRASCHDLAAATGRPTRYLLATGCLVDVDGSWVPVGAWTVRPSTTPLP
jgi:hypothetical protein